MSASRVRRIPAWLALAVMGSALIVTGHAMDALAADPPPPVLIKGAGDTDIIAELVGWKDALLAAEQPTEFSYFEKGTTTARRQLLDGTSKFVVAGVPFTAAELASRPLDAGELITVPLTVASLSVIMTEPTSVGQKGWMTAAVDPTCIDGEECELIIAPYTGPIRVPPNSLAALVMYLPISYQSNGFAQWNSPGMRANTADGQLVIQQRTGLSHSALSRTEGSAVNKYLMEYSKELAPDAWTLIKSQYETFPYEPIGERMSTRQRARGSFGQQVSNIMKTADASVYDGNSRPDNWSGNMGAIPTTYVHGLAEEYPSIGYRVVEIQNKNGDWVTPTRESIDLALAAGTTPNVAMYEKVPGAYPLVYINNLYAIAGSMTAAEANALAASIRYISTDGQAAIVDHGGTSLPAALRAEALAQADRIVETNCTEAGYEVVTSGPGPSEPDTPEVQAIAAMKHCQPIVVPTTTTTTTTVEATTTVETTTTVADTTTTVAPPETTTTTTTVPVAESTTTVQSAPPVPTTATPSNTTPTNTQPPTNNPQPFTPSASPTQQTPIPQSTQPDVDTVPEMSEPETIVQQTTTPQTTVPPAADETIAATVTTVRARGVALADLPMRRPSDGSNGPKQLGTLMLGSALFLAPRKYLMARRAAT